MRTIDSSNRILVTGASGFIGRQLVEALLARGAAVTVLARDPGRLPAEWSRRGVRLREGDLLEASTVRGVCEEVAVVFHLASVPEDAAAVRGHHQPSLEGTRTLLEEAKRAGVGRFVYTSSVKAMGEMTEGCVDETAEGRPVTAYGREKWLTERLVSGAQEAYGIETCSLRLPMVYGAHPKSNLVRMIAAIDAGRFPPIPETGNKRSMVHVGDAVQALILAAEKDEARGKTYLVTDGRVYSTREIYEAICRALGRPIPKWTLPALLLRFGGVAGDALAAVTGKTPPLTGAAVEKLLGSACYNDEKIRRELGYRPTHSLYDALPEIVVFSRASRDRMKGKAARC